MRAPGSLVTAAERELRDRVAVAAARVLPEIASAPPASVRVEPLAGGVGERTYRLSLARRSWAVRVARAQPSGALDLAAESAVASAAAADGLAPAVIGIDAGAGVLVTEYLSKARPLTPALARRAENIDRLAALLRRLHKLRPQVRRFEPERFAAEYLAALGGTAKLSTRDRARGAELERLARAYAARHPCVALCHNDLVASNVLDDGRLRLVDFEYAVSAAPVLDLAGLAGLNGYEAGERWRLAEAYYADAPVPFTPAELDDVVRLVRLLGYFWALAAARSASNADSYLEFAAEASTWLS
ncbi:MAG TPA: phosphotransferase [Gammaproteobacteria bacterium]|nr:phosphotransferase [Gammaproteobacteria bacterium]